MEDTIDDEIIRIRNKMTENRRKVRIQRQTTHTWNTELINENMALTLELEQLLIDKHKRDGTQPSLRGLK